MCAAATTLCICFVRDAHACWCQLGTGEPHLSGWRCLLLQVAEAEAAFLKQVATVATDAAQLKALVDTVVPRDVAKWQVAADIQQLRKDTHGPARTLRQQKAVCRHSCQLMRVA